jgi:hypothetical protein
MSERNLQDLIAECYKRGFEIRKDTQTDSYRFYARFEAYESGLFDLPEEAAEACIKYADTGEI